MRSQEALLLFAALPSRLLKTLAPLALLALLLPALCSCGGSQLQIDVFPETPFFAGPDVKSQMLGVASSDQTFECFESVKFFLPENTALKHPHPIRLMTAFHRVKLPDGRAAWVSEDLRYDVSNGTLMPLPIPRVQFILPILLCVATLALCIAFAVKYAPVAFSMTWKGALFAIATLLSLRLSLMLFFLYSYGGFHIVPIDELCYFRIASEMLSGVFDSPDKWNYTIGNPLLYMPFMLALKAKSYFDIMEALSLFNALLVGSLALSLVWLLVRKLAGSPAKALIAAGLWALAPFFVFPAEIHTQQIFKCIVSLADFNAGSYKFFYLFTNAGCLGQSDMPAAFLCLLCFAIPLLASKSKAWVFVSASAIFGFVCVLRINCVLLAPLLAYLFWNLLRKDGASWKRILLMVLLSLGSFTLLALPQLIVDYVQFGSPFITPYSIHKDGAGRGFVPSFLPTGLNFLLGCNYLYVALGVASLPFIRDRHCRTVLALWALPLTVFFCGYLVVGTCAVRFLILAFPALLASVVCASFWSELKLAQRIALACALLAACALVSPCHPMTPPLPFNMDNYSWGVAASYALDIAVPLFCLLVAAWLYKASKAAACFLLCFSLLYFIGSVYLLFIAMLAVLAFVLAGVFRDLLSWACCQRRPTPINDQCP